jgi:hypothetical protein
MDVEEWERTMQEIRSRGLVLVLDGGERIEEYALHGYPEGTARLRYYGFRLRECSGMTSDG